MPAVVNNIPLMTVIRLQTPEITWIGFPVFVVKTLRTFDYKIKIHSSISYENMSTIWFLYLDNFHILM